MGIRVCTLLSEGEVRLAACGIDSPRLDAEVLMAHALVIDRAHLAMMLAGGRGSAAGPFLDDATASAFRKMIKRRALREPVAYITGRREFWSLEFEVTHAVLIPRPETEILLREALCLLSPAGSDDTRRPAIVDVGTGSGAIAVALAVERPDAFVVAADISAEALEVARRNLRRHGVESRVSLLQGDLLAPLLAPELGSQAGSIGPTRRAGFHMVVSNPPYVAHQERDTLMPEVMRYEPERALFSGRGGMEEIQRLAPQAGRLLLAGGWLVMEVAAARAGAVTRLLRQAGIWQDVAIQDDLAGLPRVVRARRAGTA